LLLSVKQLHCLAVAGKIRFFGALFAAQRYNGRTGAGEIWYLCTYCTVCIVNTTETKRIYANLSVSDCFRFKFFRLRFVSPSLNFFVSVNVIITLPRTKCAADSKRTNKWTLKKDADSRGTQASCQVC